MKPIPPTQIRSRSAYAHVGGVAKRNFLHVSAGRPVMAQIGGKLLAASWLAQTTRMMQIRGSDYFVYAPDAGLFEPLVELGAEVTAGQEAGYIHFHDTPWREPSLAVFRRAGTVLCKRIPCRAERGDCLFHLATPFEA